jgi:pimeloyl-ACP methyl ester carboxylesterase
VASSAAPPSEDALKAKPSREEYEAAYAPFTQAATNDPESLVDAIMANTPDQQRATMAQYRSWMIATFADAFRQGAQAFLDEGEAIFFKPWGFTPDTIRLPVHLWHGEEDLSVPVAHAHRLAESIPSCKAVYLPSVGHFLPAEALNAIYETLRQALSG